MNAFGPLIVAAALVFNAAAMAAESNYEQAAKKIDAAMATHKMTPATTDEVRKLRADSDRMMKEGKEAEAMALLEKARKLLEMK